MRSRELTSRLTTKQTILGLLVCVVPMLLPLTVSAEVFRCIDANGQSVFSNTPCPDEAVVGNSSAHKLWREMRGLVREGESINQLLGADIESIKQCQKSSAKFSNDLDVVNEKLIKLSQIKHKNLFRAMDYIRTCGECRVSAAYDCKKATVQLDKEMKVLLNFDRKKSDRAVSGR